MTMGQPGQYRCDACGQTFDTQAKLQQHLRSMHGQGQGGQRPGQQHRCTQCGMTFESQDELREHMKTHEREKAR